MLQAVIYYIVMMILTKELVIATDQCTEYQFKSPGESCEDIYNKNPESYHCSGYYWIVKRVFCGMTYTGSSCDYIYNKYPEIYKNNPKEKSGYYRLNNNQWTFCNMTEIAAKDDDFICNYATVEVIKSSYQSFLPGQSCESIYNNNAESHEWSEFYWITSDRVYCGMNYTGSSCEHIYNNNLETANKSGYYRINESQWTYCNMTEIAANGDFITTCAGVGGGWIRIININISAGDDCPGEWRKATHSNVSFCRMASDNRTCSSASFSTNKKSYQRVCGRARGYQKGNTLAFYWPPLRETIDDGIINVDYVSGLSITYSSNPRQHIWTFATGSGEIVDDTYNCPCSFDGGRDPPSFVNGHYYCESGSTYRGDFDSYYFNDTLWDGAGCIDNCCDDTTQPWFYRQLNQTTQDNIEARICSYGFRYASTLIDQLELYIQ